MARRRRWTREEQDAMLAACAASGMSPWAFAREAGVAYTTLLHWKARGAAVTATGPRLVPVEIECHAPAHFEVAVGGAVVRVPADFDEALLIRVVRALRTC